MFLCELYVTHIPVYFVCHTKVSWIYETGHGNEVNY